ncbi:MAG: polysaccharide biosynthesis protein [Clostridia bacterium]|nr:polysaccharide biosynthesis protein [Clostridia bacterium]
MIKKLLQKYRDSDVIFKASVWFVVVTVINNAASLITQPFVNRILSVEEVGIYGVYLTWNSIFTILATFNLCTGPLEVLITKHRDDSERVVASLSSISSLIWAIFFAVIFIFIKPVSLLLGLKPIYILVLALTVWGDAIVIFWSVKKRFFYKYQQFSVLMASVFVTKSILSVILAYFFEDKLLGRTVGMCIPPLCVAIILFVSNLKNVGLKGLTKYWKRAFFFALPLIPHYLATILLSSSDKIMIQHLVNDEAVGLYSLAYTLSGLALIIFGALNSAYTPTAYELIRQKNYEELSKKTKPIILIEVAISIALMFMAPEGIYILGGEKYMISLPIVPVLVLGIFFSSFYSIFSSVEFIYEKNKVIFPITILGAGLNIILNYILIPIIGYEAAAYTTLICYLIIALCHYLATLWILRRNAYPMGTICLYLAVLVLTAGVMPLIYKVHFLIRYAIAIATAAVCGILLLRSLKKKPTAEGIADKV